MAYKHVIRAKTKNLLDYNKFNPIWKTNGIISDSGYLSKPSSTFDTSLFYPTSGYSVALSDVSKLLQLKGTYTFSISSISIGDIYIMKYNADGTMNKQIGSLTDNTKVETLTFDELTYVDIKIQREIAVVVTGLMVQEGSNPTPYTPYNYLQSNKRMIKVSDVCQIVDKNQLITEQRNTVSLTNNGDGSISLTGAATDYEWVPITQISNRKIIKDHVYLLGGNSYKNSLVAMYGRCILSTGNQDFGYFSYNNGWIRFISNYTGYFQIMLQMRDVILDNFKITPQLFDLTEMFGAGHEPATVAEFRQKFPDELYPYSPQCWLTSYQSAVVCKTKNLFDVNNAAPYNFVTDNYNSNLVWLKDGVYTTRMNNYNLGSGLRIKNGWSLPAGAYTVSVRIVDFNNIENFVIGFRYKTTDGTWKVSNYFYWSANYKVGDTIALAVTLPENTDVRLYMCYQNDNGQYLTGYVSYKDIQVEKGGSTATSYVPYQHL